MRDRRARQGKRDLARLHLLGMAGLRRAEAARLLVTDVDERRHTSDPRLVYATTFQHMRRADELAAA